MDTRICQHCGVQFTPRREHARFCSARCRSAWNRERVADPEVGVAALRWSVIAMREAVELLPRMSARDRSSALAAIGEAVWCVTIVDATLNRHHPKRYDAVLTELPRTQRPLVEGTLAGLRFVRNQIGTDAEVAAFVESSSAGPRAGGGGIVGWTWASVSAPDLASQSKRARVWEMARYRAYQDQLAGHPVGEGFQRAVAFLNLASNKARTGITGGGNPYGVEGSLATNTDTAGSSAARGAAGRSAGRSGGVG